MYLLLLGLVLLILKYMEIDPVSGWAWWQVLLPFGGAVAWWLWADNFGYTKRKAMERELERKEKRLERDRKALGIYGDGKKRRK